MDLLYEKEGKIYNNQYCEIYIPNNYFDDRYAIDRGISIETLGLVYIRSNSDGDIKLLNIPAMIEISKYDFDENDEIKIEGRTIKVTSLKFLKDSFMFNQTIPQGRLVAEAFLNYMLMGKLPKTLDYKTIIDIWWKNLEISGISFKVPSKIYEMIIANIYRNPNNDKQRFGELYGKSHATSGHNYKTGNVRDVVSNLSTFSGFVFENISGMITSGINNYIAGEEEAVSPLEKIIYY